jgi:hypothetical protein
MRDEVIEIRDGIFKLWKRPGFDSASLFSLAGQYDNPIPTRFLAPKDCSKIPAQVEISKLQMMRMRNEDLWMKDNRKVGAQEN